MKVEKKNLEKSQIELIVELEVAELKPYLEEAAKLISKEIKIEGFRGGNAPYELVKTKVGEMPILEEASRIAINKTLGKAIAEHVKEQPIGQPQIDITKMAPGNALEYRAVLAIIPEIKLGEYKNLKIKAKKEEVKDDEVDAVIEHLRETRIKEAIADKPAEDGDKIIVDIEMFLDKVPVEGGQGKGAAIIIGKEYIVPGFDKNLIKAKKGDVREFSIHYPEKHHMAHLAGKMVEFRVNVKEVYKRELPKLDDEFIKSLGAKNLEDLKKNIKENLKQEKEQKENQAIEIAIMDKIIASAKIGDLPEMLVDSESKNMIAELEQSVVSYGGKFEDYLASIKKNRDQLALDLLPDAIKKIKSALIIREIALVEKIETTDKEVEEKRDELLKQYKGYEKVEARVKEPSYKEYLRNITTNRKVVDKLKEWNVEK